MRELKLSRHNTAISSASNRLSNLPSSTQPTPTNNLLSSTLNTPPPTHLVSSSQTISQNGAIITTTLSPLTPVIPMTTPLKKNSDASSNPMLTTGHNSTLEPPQRLSLPHPQDQGVLSLNSSSILGHQGVEATTTKKKRRGRNTLINE